MEVRWKKIEPGEDQFMLFTIEKGIDPQGKQIEKLEPWRSASVSELRKESTDLQSQIDIRTNLLGIIADPSKQVPEP